jgi:3-methyladenine DNA glycosylase AlkD
MPTKLQDALTQLEALGNAKVRTQNLRSGAGEEQFGVKLGDIRKLAGKIKGDHALALDLWQSGNLDARLLGILMMKPKELSTAEMDRMVRAVKVAQVADWFSANIVKQHPAKESLREKWMQSKDPWTARAGWSLTNERITKNAEGLDLAALLDRIESEAERAPTEVQWTMNFCLAGIGIHHPKLRKRATAIGEKLGMFRDYPVSKGCTTPFAPVWIAEMVRRQG